MMAPRSFESNRANAQMSTGPKTDDGKQIVSQNSLKHGLTGKVHAALPGEEERFAEHCRLLVAALAPIGLVEETLAHDIAADRWRLNRARAMENALFAQIAHANTTNRDALSTQAEAWVDAAKGLQRLALYAHRLQRVIDKNTARLEALQAERKAAFDQARQEALLLTDLAQSKGQTYDRAPDFPATEFRGGFVYSTLEIAQLIDRGRRLEEAAAHAAGQSS
jgi:hypothetical protein